MILVSGQTGANVQAATSNLTRSLALAGDYSDHAGRLDDLSNKAADIATAHVAFGAITFATGSSFPPVIRRANLHGLAFPLPTGLNSRRQQHLKTAVIEPPTVPIERGWTMADLAELVKARLTFLVLITTAVGFYVGWHGPMDFVALAHAVIGTAFAAAGRRGA